MYECGWNIFGESPDETPKQFMTWKDAHSFLMTEFMWLIKDHSELEKEAVNAIHALDKEIEGSSFSFVIGSFVYWLKSAVDDNLDIRGF